MPSTWTGYGRESGCLRIQPVSCEIERCWRARGTMLGLKYEVTEAWRSCIGPWIRRLTSSLRWATVVFRVSHGCTRKDPRAYNCVYTFLWQAHTALYNIYAMQCVEEYLSKSCPVFCYWTLLLKLPCPIIFEVVLCQGHSWTGYSA